MAHKNIQMKKREGSQWDNLYPITLDSNVFDTNGVPLPQKLANTVDSLNDKIDEKHQQVTTQLTQIEQRMDREHDEITAQLEQNTDDIYSNILIIDSRGRDLRRLGVNLTGEVDVSDDVMNALDMYKHVIIPPDAVVGVAKTIKVGRGQSLTSPQKNVRGFGKTAVIKYIGELNRHRTVVQLGENEVDAEPQNNGSDIVFENILVDGNNLAGFGVYGTYLTNETKVDNIVATNTLEYAMYFARAWYAQFTRLRALGNKGRGLAFGMPLEYQDGTLVSWNINAPLELNNCVISDLRAHSNGKYFSVDNPNTYDPTNPSIRRQGYGLGFGVGNSFNVDKFLSEKNGGVGLYVYTEYHPLKTIKTGYLESNALNSGLDPATTMPNMIIEHTHDFGGSYVIEDVFMNYSSGGIYFTGVPGRRVWLKNIHQPRFLKSLDGMPALELYSQVLKQNVYQGAGFCNTLEAVADGVNVIERVNTRYQFSIPVEEYRGWKLIYVKGDGTTPWGGFYLNFSDGTRTSRSFPTNLGTDYVLVEMANPMLESISKSGGTGDADRHVTFKVVNTPLTTI